MEGNKFKCWLQHSDYSADELGEIDAQNAIQKFSNTDWRAELETYNEDTEDHNCPPGIGFHSDSYILHICPIDETVALTHFHYDEPGTLLGFIPWPQSKTITVNRYPLSEIPALINLHFSSEFQEIVKIFKGMQEE